MIIIHAYFITFDTKKFHLKESLARRNEGNQIKGMNQGVQKLWETPPTAVSHTVQPLAYAIVNPLPNKVHKVRVPFSKFTI